MFELVEELIKLQTKYGRKQNSVPFGDRDIPQAIMEEKEKLILDEEEEEEDDQEESCEEKRSEDGKQLVKHQVDSLAVTSGLSAAGPSNSFGDNDKQISLYTLIQRHKSYKRKLRKWRKLTRTLFTIVFPDFKNDTTSEELVIN